MSEPAPAPALDPAAHIDELAALMRSVLAPLWVAEAGSEPAPASGQPAGAALFRFLRETLEGSAESPEAFLMARYELSPLELVLLWLSLTPHLDPAAADWVARANDNVLRDTVDVELAMRLLAEDRRQQTAVWAALAPDAPLRRSGLVRLVRREHHRTNPMRHQLVAHEQLVALFYRRRVISADAARLARVLVPDPSLAELSLPSAAAELARIVEGLHVRPPLAHVPALGPAGLGFTPGALLALHGAAGSGRGTIARAAAAQLQLRVIEVDGPALAAVGAEQAMACWEAALLEAELYGDLLCVRDADQVAGADSGLASRFATALARRAATVVLCLQGTATVHPTLEPYLLWRGQVQGRSEDRAGAALWRANLASPLGDSSGVDLEALTARVSLQPLQVRKASHLAYLLAPGDGQAQGPTLDTALVERAGLAQVSRSIGGFATVSEPNLSLDDIVLDAERRDQLQDLITAARNRHRVLHEWGLGVRIQRGTGIVALFDGEPGTGKTHAAEVVAAELGLNLVRINIASIVDKYIGETEKNLTRIFAEARPDLSLLLFDEADSLFSKRTTDVSRSTDRYSNMNINVLLQLIERYEGVAVLTTNLQRAMDKAFERRFTYKIHFQMPGLEEREKIWRLLLPPEVPTAEPIDYEDLSYVELSGGDIKTAILLGAYAAARAGQELTNEALLTAAERVASDAGRVVRRPTEFD